MANSSANVDTAFHRAAENFVFGNRVAILFVFAAITAVMLFFAAQLRVDAGFKKQIPLDHEYMRTFLDWEKEFGGANRVLVAVMDRRTATCSRRTIGGRDRAREKFFGTVEKLTSDIIALDEPTMRGSAPSSPRTCASSKWSRTVSPAAT